MATRGAWRPVLEGADAERARAAVAAVADDLDRVEAEDPTLSTGYAGHALLHAYRARDGDPGSGARAGAALGRAVDTLAAAAAGPWLYFGYSGVAWAMQHLHDVADSEPGALDDIDQMILDQLEPPWTGDFELVHGLIGLGLYGFERRAAPAGAAIVDRALAHLDALAVDSPAGISWPKRDRSWLSAEEQLGNPDGYHDLGVAHGTAGVIGFLSGSGALQRWPRARVLLGGAVRWLRSQARPEGRPAYGRLAGSGLAPRPVVDGWCYGDPGVAAVLVRAGQAAAEPEWVEAGRALIAVGSRGASGEPGGALDLDLSLCHGTVGRAHLLNRIGQAIGDDDLVAAARRFYLHTLAQWTPGSGCGGFVSPGPATGPPQVGLQMGSAGIALALLATVSGVEPAWDRLLLIEPPIAG